MSKLSDECEQVYITTGQHGVYDYVRANYPKTPWAWCDPCDHETPIDTDYSCLVCASPTKPWNFENNGDW